MSVVLAHLQLEFQLGEPKLHHFPCWCCHCPLAIQFRLIVAIVVEIKAGDGASAFSQVDQTSTALLRSIRETSYSSEATRGDGAISSRWTEMNKKFKQLSHLNCRTSCRPRDFLIGGTDVWFPQYLPRQKIAGVGGYLVGVGGVT